MMPKIKKIIKKELAKYAPSTSQAGQDAWVFNEVFLNKRNGFFLDLGAHDGLTHSNTFKLEYNFGWRGICVEANPITFEELRKNRSCKCINTCLSDSFKVVHFKLEDEFGCITDDPISERVIAVESVPLEDVLKKLDAPEFIDYVSIDLEGAEDQVLSNFDLNRYCFGCITIERPSSKIIDKFLSNKYVLVRNIPGLDAFFIHESFLHGYRSSIFSYWKKRGRMLSIDISFDYF